MLAEEIPSWPFKWGKQLDFHGFLFTVNNQICRYLCDDLVVCL